MKDFNVIFDLRSIERDLFAIDDQLRSFKLFNILRLLKVENNKAYEQCRFILTAPTIDEEKIQSPENEVQHYLNRSSIFPALFPVQLHIMCLSNFKDLLKFNSDFNKEYKHFLNVSNALKLVYYQKAKLNNMKILFSNNGHQNLIGGPKIPAFHSVVGYLLYNAKGISISDSKVIYNVYLI